MSATAGALSLSVVLTLAVTYNSLNSHHPHSLHPQHSPYSHHSSSSPTGTLSDFARKLIVSDNTTTANTTTTTPGNSTDDDCDSNVLQTFETTTEQCAYVRTPACIAENGSLLFDPLEFYYCTLGKPALATIIYIVLVVVWFYLLGSTAEDFFCPALEELTDALELSPNVAGVTFLAFGNGAPDVFSNVAAYSAGSAPLGLSALLGAGVFVTMAVVGAVAFVSAPKVSRTAFVRDICFYLLASAVLLWLYFDDKVQLVEAVCFPLMYIFYVVLVVLSGKPACKAFVGRIKKKCCCQPGIRVDEAHHALLEDSDSIFRLSGDRRDVAEMTPTDGGAVEDMFDFDEQAAYMKRRSHKTPSQNVGSFLLRGTHGGGPEDASTQFLSSRDIEYNDSLMVPEVHSQISASPVGSLNTGSSNDPRSLTSPPESITFNLKQQSIDSIDSRSSRRDSDAPEAPRIIIHSWDQYQLLKRAQMHYEWIEMDWKGRVQTILAIPLLLCRLITIPQVTPAAWDRVVCATSLVFAPLFIVWNTLGFHEDVGGLPLYALALIIGPLLGVLVYKLTGWNEVPSNKVLLYSLMFISFLMSIIWIMFIANELVALLGSLGTIFGIPDAILGLTVLAWGNSLGDMVANVSIAKSGNARMAVAGCYAGPMFNMLIGQGLSLVIVTMKTYPDPFYMYDTTTTDWITPLSFMFLNIGLVLALVSVACSGWYIRRNTAVALLVAYGLFMILNILGQTGAIDLSDLDLNQKKL